MWIENIILIEIRDYLVTLFIIFRHNMRSICQTCKTRMTKSRLYHRGYVRLFLEAFPANLRQATQVL